MKLHGMEVTVLRVECNRCKFSGSEAEVKVHSCYVQEQGGRCEDYPCCGHTDGDGCQTRPEHTSEYWASSPHLGCDHEAGICEAYDDYDEDEANDEFDPGDAVDDEGGMSEVPRI